MTLKLFLNNYLINNLLILLTMVNNTSYKFTQGTWGFWRYWYRPISYEPQCTIVYPSLKEEQGKCYLFPRP